MNEKFIIVYLELIFGVYDKHINQLLLIFNLERNGGKIMKITIFETGNNIDSRYFKLSFSEGAYMKEMQYELQYDQLDQLDSTFSNGAASTYEDFVQAIKGSETVISLMPMPQDWEKSQYMLNQHCNIIKAMKEKNILHLITLGTKENTEPQFKGKTLSSPDQQLTESRVIPAMENEISIIARWAQAFGVEWTFITIPKQENNSSEDIFSLLTDGNFAKQLEERHYA